MPSFLLYTGPLPKSLTQVIEAQALPGEWRTFWSEVSPAVHLHVTSPIRPVLLTTSCEVLRSKNPVGTGPVKVKHTQPFIALGFVGGGQTRPVSHEIVDAVSTTLRPFSKPSLMLRFNGPGAGGGGMSSISTSRSTSSRFIEASGDMGDGCACFRKCKGGASFHLQEGGSLLPLAGASRDLPSLAWPLPRNHRAPECGHSSNSFASSSSPTPKIDCSSNASSSSSLAKILPTMFTEMCPNRRGDFRPTYW